MNSSLLAFPAASPEPACRSTVERLPWLLAGTLEREEETAAREHLASCAACREELAATRQAAAIFSAHLPAEALARLAVGLDAEGFDAAAVRSHLASCAVCGAELAAARGPGVADVAARRRAGSGPRRIWTLVGAVAAAIVAVVVLPQGLGQRGTASAPAPGPVASRDASALFSNGFESPSLEGWSHVEGAAASAAD